MTSGAQSHRYYCTIKGCYRRHVARGWCSLHYGRWRMHGDPHYARYENTPKICGVPDCDKPVDSYGLCKSHYTRTRRKGLIPSIENYRAWELEQARIILERWGFDMPETEGGVTDGQRAETL